LAEACWRDIPGHGDNVELDEFVVMPNHIHGLIVIRERADIAEGRGVQLNAPTAEDSALISADDQRKRRDADNLFSVMSARRNTLSVIVRTYKAAVTTACRAARNYEFAWQRNYYDHVVRNEQELSAICRYIRENPLRWALDRDNPANTRRMPAQADMADYLKDLVT
jgi:putative transposase